MTIETSAPNKIEYTYEINLKKYILNIRSAEISEYSLITIAFGHYPRTFLMSIGNFLKIYIILEIKNY